MIGAIHECLSERRKLRILFGAAVDDRCTQLLKQEKIDKTKRDTRQKFPKAKYRQLFDKQYGLCTYPLCEQITGDRHLIVPATKNEIDHIDPHRADFNHRTNLQLLHSECNRHKSSKSLVEQSKESGETMATIVGGGTG